MAKDPNLRYQTCADLCRELNLALVEDAMETEKPAPSPRWDGSKFKDWRAAIALSLLLIGAIVAFAVVNRTEQKGQSESEPRFPQTNQQEGSSFAGQNQGVESADTGTASGFGKGNWKNAKVGKNSLSSTALLKPGSEAPDASDKSPTRHTTDETGKEELGLSPMLRLGAVNYSVVKGKDRVFHFPGDVSLGDIRAVYGPKSWSEFIEARGTVTFPADDALELRLSPRVLYECPNLLRRLKEDDIRLLSVKSTRGGWFYMENTGNGTCDDAFLNVAHLKQLVYINLTSQPITDKAIKNLALDQMPQLRYLILSKTGVTAQCIASIKVLRNLETLAMSKIGHVSPVVAALKGSTKIADLDLSKGDLDDDDLKVITTMPNIEVLSISGSKSVTTKGLTLLGSLRNLTDLNVEGCNVSPLACTLFEELPKLKKLTLTGTIFTSQERAAMRKRMPNCKLDFMAAN